VTAPAVLGRDWKVRPAWGAAWGGLNGDAEEGLDDGLTDDEGYSTGLSCVAAEGAWLHAREAASQVGAEGSCQGVCLKLPKAGSGSIEGPLGEPRGAPGGAIGAEAPDIMSCPNTWSCLLAANSRLRASERYRISSAICSAALPWARSITVLRGEPKVARVLPTMVLVRAAKDARALPPGVEGEPEPDSSGAGEAGTVTGAGAAREGAGAVREEPRSRVLGGCRAESPELTPTVYEALRSLGGDTLSQSGTRVTWARGLVGASWAVVRGLAVLGGLRVGLSRGHEEARGEERGEESAAGVATERRESVG